MNAKSLSAVLVILLELMVIGQALPDQLILTDAGATPSIGSPALLGLFNEARKTNAVFDPSLGTTSRFAMDVNVTGAGSFNAAEIGLNFTATVLHVLSVNATIGCSTSCSTTSCTSTTGGCASTTVACGSSCLGWNSIPKHQIDNTRGFIDFDFLAPSNVLLNGTLAVVLKAVFQPQTSSGSTTIQVSLKSIFFNPAPVTAYQTIDGYFSNSASPEYDYALAVSPTTVSVVRTVSGGNLTQPVATVTVSTIGTVTTAHNVALSVLGLPTNATAVIGSGCNMALGSGQSCTASLQIRVNGGISGSGDTVINGTSPSLGTPLRSDSKIKFVDLNGDGHWESSEPVIYDADSSNTYSSGDIKLSDGRLSSSIQIGTSLSLDGRIKYVDANNNNVWDPGEAVIYDADLSNTYDLTTPSGTFPLAVVGNTTITSPSGFLRKLAWINLAVQPPHSPTFQISAGATSLTQQVGNYTLVPVSVSLTCTAPTQCANDTVVWSISTTSLMIFITPASFSHGSIMNVSSSSELSLGTYSFTLIAATLGTYSGVAKSLSAQFSVTLQRTHDVTVSGGTIDKPYAYSFVFCPGSCISTTLSVQVLSTVTEPSVKVNATAKMALYSSPGIMFVDTDGNGVWDCTSKAGTKCVTGESVLYDTNGDGIYESGEPVIFGTAPSIGTILSSDPGLMFADQHYNGAPDGTPGASITWTSGDSVAYETDGNSVYDSGELQVAGAIPSPILVGSTVLTNLAPGSSTIVSFSWETVSVPIGFYLILGEVTPVSGQFVMSNTLFSITTFSEYFGGDVPTAPGGVIPRDCTVNVADLGALGTVFGSKNVNGTVFKVYDLNNDGIIDVSDMVGASQHFGLGC